MKASIRKKWMECLYCRRVVAVAQGYGFMCHACRDSLMMASAHVSDAVDPHIGARERCPRASTESSEIGQEMPSVHRADPCIPCPKCGETKGWIGPRYIAYRMVILGRGEVPGQTEWIQYTCQACGYERREPTKDAVASPVTPQQAPWPSPFVAGPPQPFITGETNGQQSQGLGQNTYVGHEPLGTAPALEGEPSIRAWWVLAIACALGWYLFIVQSIARMYPS